MNQTLINGRTVLTTSELSMLDVEVTARQVHHLGHHHSLRHGHMWVKPRQGNAEELEVEAMRICGAPKR